MVRLPGEVRRGAGGRTKKLEEVARWNWGGITDRGKRLIAGAAYCESLCRPRTFQFDIAIGRSPARRDTCYWNKGEDGPSSCIRPQPALLARNVGVWKLFMQTYGSVGFQGMDGIPNGRALADVEAAARAMRIPWNEETLEKFLLIEQVWLSDVRAKYREKVKKKPDG